MLCLLAGGARVQALEVLHGALPATGATLGAPIRVDEGVLQLAAGDELVLSARAGTTFVVRTGHVGETLVEVLSGEVLAVSLQAQAWRELGPGSHQLGARAAGGDLALRQGAAIADAVMLRQREALNISARDFLRSFLSPFRRGGR